LWGERAEVSTYKCSDEKFAAEVRKFIGKKKTEKEILSELNKTSQFNVAVENVTFLKGENPNVDENWQKGLAAKNYKNDKENKVLVILVNNILPKSPKTLNEAKGLVTADFQNYLEKDWLSYLKNKYPVKIDDSVLSTVK
jgi:peptidyl-prolyl cis-trans isomerase SurA